MLRRRQRSPFPLLKIENSVDRYLQRGAGSANSAAELLGVWASTEVADMLAWLRTYNTNHPDDPVHLFGFDMQQYWIDGPELSTYLRATLPSQADALVEGISTCQQSDTAMQGGYSETRRFRRRCKR